MRKILGLVFIFVVAFSHPSLVKAKIFINEISPSTDPEWIELYNDSETSVDLAGYLLQDGNSSSSDDINLTGSILAKGYSVFSHAEGWLNNSGDTLKLYDGSLVVIDQYTYNTIDSSHTVIRSPDGADNWITTATITNGSTNPTPTPIPTDSPDPTVDPTNSPTQTPSPSPTPTKSPTPLPTKKPTPKPIKSPSNTPEVLGEETVSTPESEIVSPTPLIFDSNKTKFPLIPVIFISSGMAMIGFAAVQLIHARKTAQKP